MRDAIEAEIDRFSDFLKQIESSELNDYKDSFFTKIDHLSDLIEDSPDPVHYAKHLYDACALLRQSSLHNRTRNKPLGYAGDYLLIDWIYTQHKSDTGIGKKFDELFHTYEAAEAVRNRKSFFIDKCFELSHPSKKEVHILDLGCGSCRDVLEAYTLCNNGTQFYFDCIDHEQQAIDFAERLIQAGDAKQNVNLTCGNVFRSHLSKQYDLIWSAGLFDYLDNRIAALLIKKVWRNLKPGGHLIFGNFSQHNPTRKGMELIGKWILIHRSAEELIRICQNAGIDYHKLEVEKEPLGVNLFCTIQK